MKDTKLTMAAKKSWPRNGNPGRFASTITRKSLCARIRYGLSSLHQLEQYRPIAPRVVGRHNLAAVSQRQAAVLNERFEHARHVRRRLVRLVNDSNAACEVRLL